jgi:tetratricopeptide (TPR) repeat protein
MSYKILFPALLLIVLCGCSDNNNDNFAIITHEDSLVLARLDAINMKSPVEVDSISIKDTISVNSELASLKQDSSLVIIKETELKKEAEKAPEKKSDKIIPPSSPVIKLAASSEKIKPINKSDKNQTSKTFTPPLLRNYSKGSENNTNSTVPVNEESSLSYYEQALKKFKAGDYSGSIPLFDKEIEANPSNIDAINKRGIAETELGQHSKAIEDFSSTESIEKKMELEALLNIAEIKYKTKDYEGAITDYTYIIGHNLSNSFELYYKRGLAKAAFGKYEDASRDFNKVISINSSHSDSHMQNGLCQIHLKKYKEAIVEFSKVLNLNPKDKMAYFNTAVAKIFLKDLKGAIESYSQSINIDPKFQEAYFQRAETWVKLENVTEAKKDLGKIIEINPRSKEAYNKRGHLYLEDLSLHQAIDDFAKVSLLDPKDAEACYFKGIAEMESKKNYDACISFKKASQLGNTKAPAMMMKTCHK